MWLYNDETVSHVPPWSQFDLDLWPWGQLFYLRVLWMVDMGFNPLEQFYFSLKIMAGFWEIILVFNEITSLWWAENFRFEKKECEASED
jgi:hypothetical protein